MGDTTRYAKDVVEQWQGRPAQFWEFGHLLWRPWGYLGLSIFGPVFGRMFGDTPLEAVARFFIVTSGVCSVGAAALLFLLLRRFTFWAAWLAMLGMLFANPFLNYARAGAPYIAALCFLLAALVCARHAIERKRAFWAGISGAAFAIAFGAWFPFCLAGSGVIAYLLCWDRFGAKSPGADGRLRWRMVAIFCVVSGIAGAATFAWGAHMQGLHTVAGVTSWVNASRSGLSQHLNAVRLVTGLPRSLFELGHDGVVLKRWFFHDPYNDVAPWQLAPRLVKIGVFFTGLGALLLAGLRQKSWPEIAVLAAGAAPVVFFAVVLFEPSSSERFLPAFPFLFLFAASMFDRASMRKLVAAATAGLFGLAAASNAHALTANPLVSRKAAFLARKIALERSVSEGSALVFVPTFRDDFSFLPDIRPLDHDLRNRFDVREVIRIAAADLPAWKARFAAQTIAAWSRNEEVWLSKRFLANRPSDELSWVEGDDQRIHWRDLPTFFGRVESGRVTSDLQDGFVQVLPSPSNRAMLAAEAHNSARLTATTLP